MFTPQFGMDKIGFHLADLCEKAHRKIVKRAFHSSETRRYSFGTTYENCFLRIYKNLPGFTRVELVGFKNLGHGFN